MGRVLPAVGEGFCVDGVFGPRGDQGLNIRWMRMRFLSRDKACADTYSRSAHRQRRGQRAPAADPPSREDWNAYGSKDLTEQRQQADAPAHMATCLDALGDDEIAASAFGGDRLL